MGVEDSKKNTPSYGSAYSAPFNSQESSQKKIDQALLDTWDSQRQSLQQSYHPFFGSQYSYNPYSVPQSTSVPPYLDSCISHSTPSYYGCNNYPDSVQKKFSSHSVPENDGYSPLSNTSNMIDEPADNTPKDYFTRSTTDPKITPCKTIPPRPSDSYSFYYPPVSSSDPRSSSYMQNLGLAPQKRQKILQMSNIAYTPVDQQHEKMENSGHRHPVYSYPEAKIDFPDSLRCYVKRCFASLNDPISTAAMQKKVNSIVYQQAIQSNTFYTHGWDSAAIPDLSTSPQNFGSIHNIRDESSKRYKYLDTLQIDAGVLQNVSSDICEGKKLERQSRFSMDFNKKTWKTTNECNENPDKEFQLLSPHCTLDDENSDSSKKKIVGTCFNLEKTFLRLTTAPDPSTVRPEHVLRKSLEMMKKKVEEGASWIYIWEQMKSIRLDLTTQNIKNEFTVEVYELHARLCLKNSDITEFNQCQGILRDLYRLGLPGNVLEFTAYRLLYILYTSNIADLNGALAELTPDQKKGYEVSHAIMICEAFIINNWVRFFKLVQFTPNLGNYLIVKFLDKVRLSALNATFRAFRPVISVTWLSDSLGHNNVFSCRKFLEEVECKFLDAKKEFVLCKESVVGLAHYVSNMQIAK